MRYFLIVFVTFVISMILRTISSAIADDCSVIPEAADEKLRNLEGGIMVAVQGLEPRTQGL